MLHAMCPASPPEEIWVGRRPESDALLTAVDEVMAGRGRSVLVEGEPGIGKSALVRMVVRHATAAGCQLFHASADELTARFPLQILADALGLRGPLGASVSGAGGVAPPWPFGNPVPITAEHVLARIDEACVAAPTVLLVDDLQWADAATLAVWCRLAGAARQMALLLVATCRPLPRRTELTQLRRGVAAHDAVVLDLAPLTDDEVVELAGRLAGLPVGAELQRRVLAAGGNPLYVRETVDAFLRDDSVKHAADHPHGPPEPRIASLTGAIADRLDFLAEGTRQALRLAGLIGLEFTVTDLAAIAGAAPSTLVATLDEAVTGGILTAAGDRMRFRHGLIRDALYEAIPPAVRAALHRQAAEALDAAGAPVERVAAQLLMGPTEPDGWSVAWLAGHGAELAERVPVVAEELLLRLVQRRLPDESHRASLEFSLLTASFRSGSEVLIERVRHAAQAGIVDPERSATLAWMSGYTFMRLGRFEEALQVVADAASTELGLPTAWLARLQSLYGMILSNVGRYGEARERAESALESARAGADPAAAGYAYHLLGALAMLTHNVGRAVEFVDAGLADVGADPRLADLRMLLLCDRISWSERAAEAQAALDAARPLTDQVGDARATALCISAAGYLYLSGRWDDALVEIEAAAVPAGHGYASLLSASLSALIAVRRDSLALAEEHLAAALAQPTTGIARANTIYLLLARAAAAERAGDPGQCLRLLAPAVDPNESDLFGRQLFLPVVVRLAQETDEPALARRAADAAAADAVQEERGGRSLAARWCAGLIDGDLAALDDCAVAYREAGWMPSAANVFEDAAVLSARAGDRDGARRRATEAVDIYADIGAEWELSRADARLRALGVRRGQRARPPRPSTGWDALTKTELRIARLVGEGRSNPDIAAALFLSRRTVQTHVTHILAKLGMRSRMEVVRAMASHPVG
jgi:DNA-binding CsgD family transcriptional regulator